MLIFLVAILVDFAFVVVIVIGPGAFVFSHLQLVATYHAIKRNFQKIFLKLQVAYKVTNSCILAYMVADATPYFCNFFWKIVFSQFV